MDHSIADELAAGIMDFLNHTDETTLIDWRGRETVRKWIGNRKDGSFWSLIMGITARRRLSRPLFTEPFPRGTPDTASQIGADGPR